MAKTTTDRHASRSNQQYFNSQISYIIKYELSLVG